MRSFVLLVASLLVMTGCQRPDPADRARIGVLETKVAALEKVAGPGYHRALKYKQFVDGRIYRSPKGGLAQWDATIQMFKPVKWNDVPHGTWIPMPWLGIGGGQYWNATAQKLQDAPPA